MQKIQSLFLIFFCLSCTTQKSEMRKIANIDANKSEEACFSSADKLPAYLQALQNAGISRSDKILSLQASCNELSDTSDATKASEEALYAQGS